MVAAARHGRTMAFHVVFLAALTAVGPVCVSAVPSIGVTIPSAQSFTGGTTMAISLSGTDLGTATQLHVRLVLPTTDTSKHCSG